MSTWGLIVLLSVITFANRYFFFSKTITYHPGEKLRRFLSFSTQSILTALWVPIVFRTQANGMISYTDINYLIATVFVLILGFYRLNMLLVVILGSALFFVLRFDLIRYVF